MQSEHCLFVGACIIVWACVLNERLGGLLLVERVLSCVCIYFVLLYDRIYSHSFTCIVLLALLVLMWVLLFSREEGAIRA